MSKRTLTQAASGAIVSSSMPRRRLVFTPSQVVTRGRIARYKGTISRGYTRRSGYFGRYVGAGAGAGMGEMKFFDTTRAFAAPSATGTIMNLSLALVPQGVTEATRIGRKYTIRHVGMKGHFRLVNGTAAATTGDRVRVIVYQDKQTNGATAAVTDILETAVVDSFYNLANQGRFNILMDRQVVTNSMGGAGNGTSDTFAEVYKLFNFNKRCTIAIENSTTDGAVTGMRSNNIGVLAISHAALTEFGYTSRIRFTDQ